MSTHRMVAPGAAKNAIDLPPFARRSIRLVARFVNPLVLAMAGRRWMAIVGILHHRGRRSGHARHARGDAAAGRRFRDAADLQRERCLVPECAGGGLGHSHMGRRQLHGIRAGCCRRGDGEAGLSALRASFLRPAGDRRVPAASTHARRLDSAGRSGAMSSLSDASAVLVVEAPPFVRRRLRPPFG